MADAAFGDVHDSVAVGEAIVLFFGVCGVMGVAVDDDDGGIEFTKGGGDRADFSAEEIAVGADPFIDMGLVDCDELGVQGFEGARIVGEDDEAESVGTSAFQ